MVPPLYSTELFLKVVFVKIAYVPEFPENTEAAEVSVDVAVFY